MTGWFCWCEGYHGLYTEPWVPDYRNPRIPNLVVRTLTQAEAERQYEEHIRSNHGGHLERRTEPTEHE